MKRLEPIAQQLQQVKLPHVIYFLLLLLSADFAFLGLHVIQKFTGLLGSNQFLVSVDRGYGEAFQYIKDLWIILLFASIYLKTREFGYVVWMLLFGFLLCTDALRLHEHAGVFFANKLGLPDVLGVRGQDFGELAFSAIVGGGLLSLIGFCYFCGSEKFRPVTQVLVVCCLLIAFFGVFVDILHMPFDGSFPGDLFEIVEDGGEMFVFSIVAAYVFGIATVSNYTS